MLDKCSVYYSCEKSLFTHRARNDLIKLPLFLIKCKAMMGICIYWFSKTQGIWKKVLTRTAVGNILHLGFGLLV